MPVGIAGGFEHPSPPRLMRKATGGESVVQAPGNDLEGEGGDAAAHALEIAMTGRQGPLPHAQEMAARYSVDLSQVRCFFGPEAQRACAMVGAEAFAVANVIVFSSDSPSVDIVAHEVAHVLQQGGEQKEGALQSAPSSLDVSRPGDPAEADADRAAAGTAASTLAADGPILARYLATNARGVWLVSNPSQYRSTIIKKLALGTRVVIVDRGDSEPFNQVTDDTYRWVQVRVTTGPDMGLGGWVMEVLLHDQPETQSVSTDEATRLFNELAGATFTTTSGDQAPIPFHYPPDGCYARAHIMMQLLTEKGYASRKVFAVSRTASGGGGLRVATDYAGDVAVGEEPAVRWWYHVAPIIQVTQDDGSTVDMVIDPSMTSGPIAISQWTGMMSNETFENMTVGEVEQLVQSSGGEYPSGRSIVYTADRHAYGPMDFGPRTEADSESAHAGAHDRVSGYATDYAPAHELAARIRQELRNDPIDVDGLRGAVTAASDTARQGLRALFSNLLRELEHARDSGRLTTPQYDQLMAAINS
jgi:hypothetical protein